MKRKTWRELIWTDQTRLRLWYEICWLVVNSGMLRYSRQELRSVSLSPILAALCRSRVCSRLSLTGFTTSQNPSRGMFVIRVSTSMSQAASGFTGKDSGSRGCRRWWINDSLLPLLSPLLPSTLLFFGLRLNRASNAKHVIGRTGHGIPGMEASAASLHSSGQDSGIVARTCHCSHSSSPSSGESSKSVFYRISKK